MKLIKKEQLAELTSRKNNTVPKRILLTHTPH